MATYIPEWRALHSAFQGLVPTSDPTYAFINDILDRIVTRNEATAVSHVEIFTLFSEHCLNRKKSTSIASYSAIMVKLQLG